MKKPTQQFDSDSIYNNQTFIDFFSFVAYIKYNVKHQSERVKVKELQTKNVTVQHCKLH